MNYVQFQKDSVKEIQMIVQNTKVKDPINTYLLLSNNSLHDDTLSEIKKKQRQERLKPD